MQLSESDKKLLAYVGVGTKSTKYSLVRVELTGELNQHRYYLADTNDQNANPIMAPTDDGYFTHLRELPPINLLSWTTKDGSKRSQIYKSTIPMDVSGMNVQVAPKYCWGTPPKGSALINVIGNGIYTDTNTFISEPVVVPIDKIDGMTGNFMTFRDGGYLFNYANQDYATTTGSPYSYTMPSEGNGYVGIDGNERAVVDTMDWPEISSSHTLGNVFLEIARAGLCKMDDFVTNIPLGVSWTTWSTNNASRKVCHPKLAGCRRVAVFMAIPQGYSGSVSGAGWNLVAFTGYLWGEGDDVYAVAFGSKSGTTITRKLAFSLMPKDSVSPTGRAGVIKRDVSGYPLDGIAMLNNSIVGKLDLVDTSLFTFGNSEVEVLDYTLNCEYATGSILPSDYYNYLTTGVGLYVPRTEEQAQKTLATWSKLNAGLYYKVQTCNLSKTKLTLKDTSYYKEYARMRAKACKDNNYMDLKYNDQYTMKTVQNKLDAIQGRTIWMQDGGSLSSLASGASSRSQGVIVIASSTLQTKFKATITPKGGSQVIVEYLRSEEGVEALIDAYSGYSIVDSENILTGLIGNAPDGSTLADANRALSFDEAKYDLRPATFIAGVAPSYDDLIKSGASNDSKVSLLANQVTDFAKFEGVIQRWLNDFSQRSVINKLISTRANFKNIDVKTLNIKVVA